MRTSWKLGRVAGIDLFLHPSFFILLAIFGVSGGLGSIVMVSAAFGCVLLHELGHALMARGFGIGTENITLYMIGGVARLRRMPKAPGAELLIALAGPAVNVAISLTLWLVVSLGMLGGPGSDLPLRSFVDSLLMINIGLAVFNMIPAFPMDGGRIFRALLSGWLGRERATMIAAGLGRGLALIFGLCYLVYAPSLWDALAPLALAAFVYMAAGAELMQVLAEGRGRGPGRGEDEDDGMWIAPPGFLWVSRGKGVWQLAPIPAHSSGRGHSSWR